MADLNPTEQMHHDALSQIKWYQELNKKHREELKSKAKKETEKAAKEGGPTVDAVKALDRDNITKNAPTEETDASPGSVTVEEGARSITPGGTK